MKTGIINFEVYEDGVNFLGIAKVTLPDTTNKVLTVNGAGIAGDVDIPVPGHKDAMSVKIEFLDAPEAAYSLAEHRVHIIDIRAAHEDYDATTGAIKVVAYKHILEIIPKSQTGGTLAPTAAQAASGEYSCLSIQDYIDGKLMRHYDPLKIIDIDASGNDRGAPIRAALGK